MGNLSLYAVNVAAAVLRNCGESVRFIGPEACVDLWMSWGVPAKRCMTLRPGDSFTVKDTEILALDSFDRTEMVTAPPGVTLKNQPVQEAEDSSIPTTRTPWNTTTPGWSTMHSPLSRIFPSVPSLWNPLFPVNYMDREIRKDMASHTRETVQFPRNVSNLMLRLNLYLFNHNVGKPYRINDPAGCSRRHAQEAGMRREHLASIYEDLFTKRVFMKKGQRLSPSALRTLNRQWVTPLKKRPEKLWKYLRP